MDTKLFSIASRLCSTPRAQRHQILSKTLTRDLHTGASRRAYHRSRGDKESLYSRISPLASPSSSVVPELDRWVDGGNKVRVAELQRIIQDLRMRRKFSHALEVSEWMNKKGICVFTPTEHAVQLDLIGRVRGFLSAESHFTSLKDEEKTGKTYGALLNCYVRQRQIDKSLFLLERMKTLGFASSPLTYNDMMCLYTNLGQHEKVSDVLMEMKNDKVSPDNFSYRLCINSYGVRSDIEGMERVLNEMEGDPNITMDWNTYSVVANIYLKAGLTDKATDALKKSEEKLDKKHAIGYNHLISLYARLGNKVEVLRLWGLEKSACRGCINRDYITIIESLVRLGEFEEAEALLKDWESSGNCYDVRVPNIVVFGYSEKGLFEKAEVVLKDLEKKGKKTTSKSWGVVAAGYLEKGEMAKAVDCMKAGLSLYEDDKEWRPNSEVITLLLSWLGDNGSVKEVEAFVGSLKNVIPMNRQMYHALMKAAIRDGKIVDGLLNSMKADRINENSTTKKILNMRQSSVESPC